MTRPIRRSRRRSGIRPTPDDADSLQPRRAGISASWTAPLPPPNAFRQYEETLPGAANRILEMAESQQIHNQSQERIALEQDGVVLEAARNVTVGDSRRSTLGLVLAFVVSLLGIACGTFLSVLGREGIGVTFAVAPLVGLAGVFVYGSRARRAERRRNAGPEVETPEPAR